MNEGEVGLWEMGGAARWKLLQTSIAYGVGATCSGFGRVLPGVAAVLYYLGNFP